MPSLPSNFETLLNMEQETQPFETYWPLIGKLLGLETKLEANGAWVDFYKDTNSIFTIYKTGETEIHINGSQEVIKKLLVIALKEYNNGNRL